MYTPICVSIYYIYTTIPYISHYQFVLWGWHSFTGDNVFQMSKKPDKNHWKREDMVAINDNVFEIIVLVVQRNVFEIIVLVVQRI